MFTLSESLITMGTGSFGTGSFGSGSFGSNSFNEARSFNKNRTVEDGVRFNDDEIIPEFGAFNSNIYTSTTLTIPRFIFQTGPEVGNSELSVLEPCAISINPELYSDGSERYYSKGTHFKDSETSFRDASSNFKESTTETYSKDLKMVELYSSNRSIDDRAVDDKVEDSPATLCRIEERLSEKSVDLGGRSEEHTS